MSITQGPGFTIRHGPAEQEFPEGGILYDVFGEGINLVNFSPKIDQLDDPTRNLLLKIARRLTLIEKLASFNYKSYDVDIDSLLLYLLCTCIDALASPLWLPLSDWLQTKKKKYHIDDRDVKINQILIDNPRFTSNSELISSITEIDKVYKQHFGVGQRFISFFSELPDEVRYYLSSSYMIFRPWDGYIDPMIREQWAEKPENTRLDEIAKYLYVYRRNDFTHGAKSHATSKTMGISPTEIIEQISEEPRKYRLLFFYQDNNPGRDPDVTVIVSDVEYIIIETIIKCYCRYIIDIPHGSNYISQRLSRSGKKRLLREILEEIQINWRTYKYYSIDWLAEEDHEDRYYGMPEFQTEWLSCIDEVDLSGYGIIYNELASDVRSLLVKLSILNDQITKVNEEYPPLYLRRQRSDLDGVPEDRNTKQLAKSELFSNLNKLREFQEVRWLLAQLVGNFSIMFNTVPDQGGWQTYSYSHPSYRFWL